MASGELDSGYVVTAPGLEHVPCDVVHSTREEAIEYWKREEWGERTPEPPFRFQMWKVQRVTWEDVWAAFPWDGVREAWEEALYDGGICGEDVGIEDLMPGDVDTLSTLEDALREKFRELTRGTKCRRFFVEFDDGRSGD